jgi:hypothetical protein
LHRGGLLQCVRGICGHVQKRNATKKTFGSSPVHSSREGVILSMRAKPQFCGSVTNDASRDSCEWRAFQSSKQLSDGRVLAYGRSGFFGKQAGHERSDSRD